MTNELTGLLQAWSKGDKQALEEEMIMKVQTKTKGGTKINGAPLVK